MAFFSVMGGHPGDGGTYHAGTYRDAFCQHIHSDMEDVLTFNQVVERVNSEIQEGKYKEEVFTQKGNPECHQFGDYSIYKISEQEVITDRPPSTHQDICLDKPNQIQIYAHLSLYSRFKLEIKTGLRLVSIWHTDSGPIVRDLLESNTRNKKKLLAEYKQWLLDHGVPSDSKVLED